MIYTAYIKAVYCYTVFFIIYPDINIFDIIISDNSGYIIDVAT